MATHPRIKTCLFVVSLVLVTQNVRSQDYFEQLQQRLGISPSEQEGKASPKPPSTDKTAEQLPRPVQPTSPIKPSNPDVPAVSPVPLVSPIDQSPFEMRIDPIPQPETNDRPYVGMTVEKLTGGGMGLRVVEVATNSPAWKSGISVGDTIVAVNGVAISDLDQFAAEIMKLSPRDIVQLLADRNGRTTTRSVVLGSANLAARSGQLPTLPPEPMDRGELSPDLNFPLSADRPPLGVSIERLTEAARQRFGLPVYKGALVVVVQPNSVAEQAGLRPGDCIVEIDGRVIQSDQEMLAWVKQSPSFQNVPIRYFRGRDLVSSTLQTPAIAPLQNDRYKPLSEPEGRQAELRQLQAEIDRLQIELEQAIDSMESLKSQ